MRTLKTVEGKVRSVLKEHPEARNDDMKLYLLVCTQCIYETHGLSIFSFEDVMNNYKALGCPCFESCTPEVRRARARRRHVFHDYALEDD